MQTNLKKENINPNSLILDIDHPFLQYPSKPGKTQFATITTTIRNIDGKPLGNLKVFISDHSEKNLQRVKILDSNHNEITVQEEGMIEGFYVSTDPHGKIKFFIYPLMHTPLVINLTAQIKEYTDLIQAKYTLYIANHSLENEEKDLISPEIINFVGENLKSDGTSKFTIKIEEYTKFTSGDYILFFVNDIYTKVSIQLRSASDLNSINVPYCIFNKGERSSFSYVVIGSLSEYMGTSMPIDLIYQGNPHNQPWTDVDRTYDACTVYNSGGPSPKNIVRQYDWITDATISGNSGKFGQYGQYGLFVKIIGGLDDSTNASLVPFGSKVTLNLYITSQEKKTTKYFKNKQMPIGANNTAELIIPIPSEYITNNPNGLIYLDYQIGSDNDVNVSYGNIWFAKIDTRSI
ncbi:hypothetical protein ID853_01480 [Xenorhabdus sp. Vera]|uniref:hypothetical protein n=1 Tax=Xenorhabdus koppenhoeferi TaxID=351659 RepID=UPI0019AA2C8A|nr:hypothetical protein [Xenorhabdus sp. Vera]MBD2809588.1 hypothetical protein [Xenorhabdus sp. Vera]